MKINATSFKKLFSVSMLAVFLMLLRFMVLSSLLLDLCEWALVCPVYGCIITGFFKGSAREMRRNCVVLR